MLIKYLYDFSNWQRKPWGCIVADKRGDEIAYGVSLCCPKDRFNKNLAKEIAYGRLLKKAEVKVPNGDVCDTNGIFSSKEFAVDNALKEMESRAEKYFKILV